MPLLCPVQIIPQITDIYERTCILLCPVMKSGQTALDAVAVCCFSTVRTRGPGFSPCVSCQRLLKAGVEEENIVLVAITGGPGAMDRLAKTYPKLTVVTGSIEAGVDKKCQLMPGVGVFGLRYRPNEDDSY